MSILWVLRRRSTVVLQRRTGAPIVEDDDIIVQSKLDTPFVEADDLDMDMGYSSSSSSTTPSPQSLPPLQVTTLSQRISSPPPASSSPRPHAILPTSYMVALLTMRSCHLFKKPGSSSSSSCSSSGSDQGKVKRKSGLRVIVEID